MRNKFGLVMVGMTLVGVSGCSSVPNAINPISWYRDATGLSKNDDLGTGENEENLAAAPHYFLKKFGGTMELLHGFIQVDDVNLVPLLEDERLHLRVPALGLVAKMHACFQELRD